MKYILLISLILVPYLQAETYRVYLIDKGPKEFTKESELYQNTENLYNEKALERRLKTFEIDYGFSIDDAPLYKPYIDSILRNEIEIIHALRWNNYLVVKADSAQINKIINFDFIKDVIPTTSKMQPQSINKKLSGLEYFMIHENGVIEYSDNNFQLEHLNIPKLHSMGFTGSNSTIGFLDSGFEIDSLKVRDKQKFLGEYDFVENDENVGREEGDVFNQAHHGTEVASTVLSFIPNRLIGASFNSRFYLAKTEYLPSETKIEEDNFVAAVEWLETLGVDVINSSLGYLNFDQPNDDYIFNELDGNTTITSNAVNKAVHRGITFIASAGNSGPRDSTIASPADADSVVAVAAINSLDTLVASFSSRGPRCGDGIYPHLAAQGSFVFTSTPSNTLGFQSSVGTSFSSPLISGATSILLSAFPELRPWETRQILFESASQYEEPDFTLGYGIPDMFKAFKSAGIAISKPSYYQQSGYVRVAVYILSEEELTGKYLKLRNQLEEIQLEQAGEHLYYCDLSNELFVNGELEVHISATNSDKSKRYPFQKNEYFLVKQNIDQITCGVDPFILPTSVLGKNTELQLIQNNQIVTILMEEGYINNYELFSVSGTLIERTNVYSKELKISKANLNSGAYIAKIRTVDKYHTIKFIVSK